MLLSDKSKFVKANVNVKDQDIVRFMDEGFEKKTPYGIKLEINVRLPNGETKALSLNAGSERRIKAEYGPDTAAWVGKDARVHIREEEVANEFRDIIYLTHPAKNLKGEVVFE